MLVQGQVTSAVPSSRPTGNPNIYQAMLGEVAVSEILGRYSNLVQSGQVFSAYATVTAPVAFSTAAGVGGPLLWNSSSTKAVHVLAALIGGVSTAYTTTAGTLGLTGNSGQTSAPSSTTTIDASGNMLIGGPASAINAYRIGTVTNAGNRFIPLSNFSTAALTALTQFNSLIDLGGMLVVQPNCWCAIAANAATTAGVQQFGLIWAELPV